MKRLFVSKDVVPKPLPKCVIYKIWAVETTPAKMLQTTATAAVFASVNRGIKYKVEANIVAALMDIWKTINEKHHL